MLRYLPFSAFLLMVALCQNALSQVNFQPCTIVKNNGDTLLGELDYREWDKNPQEISFRPSKNDKTTQFNAAEINSFTCMDDTYLGAIVEVDGGPFKDPDLKASDKPEWRTDTTFLRVLIDGKKTLLFHKDVKEKEHFFILVAGDFRLLFYKRSIYELLLVNTNIVVGHDIMVNQEYKKQLAIYLQDCPEVASIIKEVPYNTKGLLKVFNKYYEYTNVAPTYVKKKEKVGYYFGALAGASYTSFDLNSATPAGEIVFPSSIYPSGGISLDMVLPRMRRRLSFVNDLYFTKFSTDGQIEKIADANNSSITYVNIEYAHIKLATLVKYKLWLSSFDLYCNVGITNGFATQAVNYKKVTSNVFSIVNESEGLFLPTDNTRKYEQGATMGLGLTKKHISAEFRFERGNGFSRNPAFGTKPTRWYVFLKYTF